MVSIDERALTGVTPNINLFLMVTFLVRTKKNSIDATLSYNPMTKSRLTRVDAVERYSHGMSDSNLVLEGAWRSQGSERHR